jgi:hypothetical protein
MKISAMAQARALFSTLPLIMLAPAGECLAVRPSSVTRRRAAAAGVAAVAFSSANPIRPSFATKRPACGDIESCREAGERKEADKEAATPTVRLGNGISYKETSRGAGSAVVEKGDVLQVTYGVFTGAGNYMYSLPSKEPGARDGGETYRVVVGKSPSDVPAAVEQALLGARQGSTRLVEVVPALGFATSSWEPAPTGFAGKQGMERYRTVLNGNGLQPGYNAVLLFEISVQNIRKGKA